MTQLILLLWLLFWLWALVRLLTIQREPSSTIAWLLFVSSVPIMGAVLFLLFGSQRLERRAIKRKKKMQLKMANTSNALRSPGPTSQDLSSLPLPTDDTRILKLASKISEYDVTASNTVEIFTDPSKTLSAMRKAVQEAKHFIHLEYYIIASDEVTTQLFDDLVKAAGRGVEVRILYDALGSLFLKRLYFRKLTQAGIKIAGFLPFSLLPQHFNFNFRNHRKILIVDGNTAFTGGANIGKQYLGRLSEKQWRDTTIKVTGSVCHQLQDVFAKDWHFTTHEELFFPKYYPAIASTGDSLIQVLESAPNAPFQILHNALFLALNSANQDIFLTTPYFVPDPAIKNCLMVAALRGIKVQLLLPAKTDAKLVQFASRSFYQDLLEAGVFIYEYQPRILHSKVLIIDNKWTMIGSSNMDIRSFRLNFELNLLIYGNSLAEQAKSLFEKDLSNSLRIKLSKFSSRPLGRKMLENACRLLSPIL